MAATKRVNTATLIRGELYSYRTGDPNNPTIRFEANKPVPIESKELLSILEELHDVTFDGDGEEFEKPRFRIDRNVPWDEGSEGKPKGPTRLSSTRKVTKRPRKKR